MKIKLGQAWIQKDKTFFVVGIDPEICVFSDPEDKSTEEGYAWSGPEAEFRKLFSPKK